jgi:hypothetical protein
MRVFRKMTSDESTDGALAAGPGGAGLNDGDLLFEVEEARARDDDDDDDGEGGGGPEEGDEDEESPPPDLDQAENEGSAKAEDEGDELGEEAPAADDAPELTLTLSATPDKSGPNALLTWDPLPEPSDGAAVPLYLEVTRFTSNPTLISLLAAVKAGSSPPGSHTLEALPNGALYAARLGLQGEKAWTFSPWTIVTAGKVGLSCWGYPHGAICMLSEYRPEEEEAAVRCSNEVGRGADWSVVWSGVHRPHPRHLAACAQGAQAPQPDLLLGGPQAPDAGRGLPALGAPPRRNGQRLHTTGASTTKTCHRDLKP